MTGPVDLYVRLTLEMKQAKKSREVWFVSWWAEGAATRHKVNTPWIAVGRNHPSG